DAREVSSTGGAAVMARAPDVERTAVAQTPSTRAGRGHRAPGGRCAVHPHPGCTARLGERTLLAGCRASVHARRLWRGVAPSDDRSAASRLPPCEESPDATDPP